MEVLTIDPLLRPTDVQREVKRSDATIRRMVKAGKFPPPIYLENGEVPRRFWHQSVIAGWLEAQKRAPTTNPKPNPFDRKAA
jgi:predicted DNA-binding transcriptional regulator AlpA